ncbi:LutC/YkgG family protein [Desulfovibrio inopinatus]|uniref:LutC/YkgG family protein n=1 Tax=Desulfovibrio inopinatus TaxID=102109 RepID=UPI00040F4370|nr:LUD domain-containing protein [Desulfovibrio inopinatus]
MTDPSQRTAFLTRVRNALRHTSDHDTFDSDEAAAIQAFNAKAGQARDRTKEERLALAEGLDATGQAARFQVYLVKTPDEIGPILASIASDYEPEWSQDNILIAWDHPLVDAALPSITAALPDALLSTLSRDPEQYHSRARSSFIGITGADFIVAESATILMLSGPGRPRSTSLLPSIHAAIVSLDRICADYGELYSLLREYHHEHGLPNTVTFVSGPSKTADIEAVMVHGAHGPRAACLFIVLGE